MSELLSMELCDKLRGVINQTNIFMKDKEEGKKFNLICAIMDRFDSSAKYINAHLDKIKLEEDFIEYMVHCCIIKDGIKCIYNVFNKNLKNDNKTFKQVYTEDPLYIQDETSFSDDKFFEYFRALVFAHPFLTNRSIPNPVSSNEIQYSPFVIVSPYGVITENDEIGVMIYSNERKESFSITFELRILNEYIKWKYEMIKEIIDEFKKIIISKEEKWKEHKVTRSSNHIEILKNVKDILEERYIETYNIDELIEILQCKSTELENTKSVNIFRNQIVSIIPKICDIVDDYKHGELYNIIGKITDVTPKGYNDMAYQLEKIFCYLNTDEEVNRGKSKNVSWGLKQAKAFSEGFAKKWVKINTDNMKFDEIKMLTRVACYLEYIEQQK